MQKFALKSAGDIKIMAEGGRKLARVRRQLAEFARVGVTTIQIDKLASQLLKEEGGNASFKMVPGYKHATCLSVNDVVVHGVPDHYRLKAGDIIGIDVGMYWEGYHTDTSVTVRVSVRGEKDPKVDKFLEIGRKCLDRAIKQAKVGRRIADISRQMEKIEEYGYSAVRALTGHGIGRNLHEEPAIPCFTVGEYDHSPLVREGMVLAIEIMYNAGRPDVVYKNDDGWTIATADGKISGLFEETVAVTKNGPVILTVEN